MVACLLGCSALGSISQPTWSGCAGLHPRVCQGGLGACPVGHRSMSCSDPGRHQVMPPSCSMSHVLPLLCMSPGTSEFLSSQSPVGWYQVLPHPVWSRGWEVLPAWCSSSGSGGRWHLIPEFSGHHFPSVIYSLK